MSDESNDETEVITISYDELIEATTTTSSFSSATTIEKIGKAFGSSSSTASLGILCISSVPNFTHLRQKLLPLSRKLATLPSKELNKVVDESSGYQVGWSHGREKVEGGKFDVGKGSFYANPLVDNLLKAVKERRQTQELNEEVSMEELEQIAIQNPAFFAPNVWPTESIPELEECVKDMGQLVWKVGCLVAQLCDAYVVEKCPGYNPTKIQTVLKESKCCKARLLHYFAPDNKDNTTTATGNDENCPKGNDEEEPKDSEFSDWCGWHNDHGSLTGLVPAMYLDNQGQEISCPDPTAGLYIKSRNGKLVHVTIPSNCLAFQIGETSQVHSGGILQATPHAVRGCHKNSNGITRESFAVFMEPEYHGDMDIPDGKTVEDTQRKDSEQFLPPSVRTLRSRWKVGMNFGEFSDATFAAFY